MPYLPAWCHGLAPPHPPPQDPKMQLCHPPPHPHPPNPPWHCGQRARHLASLSANGHPQPRPPAHRRRTRRCSCGSTWTPSLWACTSSSAARPSRSAAPPPPPSPPSPPAPGHAPPAWLPAWLLLHRWAEGDDRQGGLIGLLLSLRQDLGLVHMALHPPHPPALAHCGSPLCGCPSSALSPHPHPRPARCRRTT